MSMDDRSESRLGWGGDSNAEWMNLTVEAADIGTWEFDLEQGTGFVFERCAQIMGYSKAWQRGMVQFSDWLSMINWENRRRVNQACDPEGDGELNMRLQLIDTGGVIRHVLVRGRAFCAVSHRAESSVTRKAVHLLGILRYLSHRHIYQRPLTE